MSTARALSPDEPLTLIDELLAEQRSLTAVAQFSRLHESHELPAQARYYRNLLPLAAPRPGEQYAFEVDLDQCSGCKGCVTACHALNGLDEEEAWRDVGVLAGGLNGHAVQQTVTTACHHCVDPGCLNGCPVLAYEKDPVTGIVRHLDDQCIGCQYCVMKCPYDVPKYSERLGIVRKCDMCSQRLAEGEAPACVQACPNEAIRITVVRPAELRAQYRHPETLGDRGFAEPDFNELAAGLSAFKRLNNFLPDSPEPDYTLPTTRYKTRNPQTATLLAADRATLHPQPAHWPLVFLLVLSQLSVGLLLAIQFLAALQLPAAGNGERDAMILAATFAMALALGLATLHLGRPFKAWRAFLGWRTSWFSREALAFGAYLGCLSLASASVLLTSSVNGWLLAVAVGLGLASLFCSFMLYVDTRRDFWSPFHTGVRFGGTTILLGIAGGLIAAADYQGGWIALMGVSLVKLALESAVLRHGNVADWTPLKRTARLITGSLRPVAFFRVTSLLFAGVVFPALSLAGMIPRDGGVAGLVFAGLFVGELAERHLFFAAVSPTRMPGGIAP